MVKTINKAMIKRLLANERRKDKALAKVAEYIVDCESNEYDNYVSFCEENDLKPSNIKGRRQITHVYALALVGLGLEFPTD